MNADQFALWCQQHRNRYEAASQAALATLEGTSPAELLAAMRYSLDAGGKRIRPLLVYAACEAVGGDPAQADGCAVAVEWIHTYSLIHDDLPAMDNDDLRRGKPTSHKQFGEAMAILAGDALLTEAFACVSRAEGPNVARMVQTLVRGAGSRGMVGGQVWDLAAEGRIQAQHQKDFNFLQSIHAKKTGALLQASLELGLLAAKSHKAVNESSINAVHCYGEAFGILFQLTDDLLDVSSSAAESGKLTQKDAQKGKLTYPGLLGEAESLNIANRLLERAFEAIEPLGQDAATLRFLVQSLMNRKK